MLLHVASTAPFACDFNWTRFQCFTRLAYSATAVLSCATAFRLPFFRQGRPCFRIGTFCLHVCELFWLYLNRMILQINCLHFWVTICIVDRARANHNQPRAWPNTRSTCKPKQKTYSSR